MTAQTETKPKLNTKERSLATAPSCPLCREHSMSDHKTKWAQAALACARARWPATKESK